MSKPLFKSRSKPAVPIAGKYRLIDIPISNCLNSELRRIFLLTQFNSSSLHRHIQESYRFDYFSLGFVEILAAQQLPHSLGLMYEDVTEHLGFLRSSDEYKVMGLASYGVKEVDLSWLLAFGGGDYRLNHEEYLVPVGPNQPFPSKQEGIYTDRLIERLGRPRLRDEPIEQRHMDLAYSAQKTLERAVIDLVGDHVLMFESDYPHPETIFPDHADTVIDWRRTLGEPATRKLMWENAARFFRLASTPWE